jgi:hypothetical protein
MPLVDLTPRERDALQRFVLEYAPDAKLEENGWEKPDIEALDIAYDKLFETVAQ